MRAAPLKRRITRRSRHREIRKKGFILSFGDIILPFVGVVAIGLLVVAGKLFFVNGLVFSPGALPPQVEGPLAGATSTSSNDVEVPLVEEVPQAVLTRTETDSADRGTELSASPKAPLPLDVTVIPYGDTAARLAPLPLPTPTSSKDAGAGMVKVDRTPVKQKEAPTPQVQKKVRADANANPVKPPQPKSAPRQKPQPPAPQKSLQQGTAVWRVQVGAYSSKGIAQETVAKLTKAGYRATVFSGPRFHKVWVQAGNTKQSADAAILQLKKLGFPQSYAVPPAQR